MRKDLIELKKYGNLIVISDEFIKIKERRYVKCMCLLCNSEKVIYWYNVKNEKIKSCGCIIKKNNKVRLLKHGESSNKNRTKEYRLWNHAKGRCYNINDKAYKNYGGRGIIMQESWKNSYEEFLKYIGRSPYKNFSLDRVDNNKGYVEGNVRWTDAKTQSRNRRNVKSTPGISC